MGGYEFISSIFQTLASLAWPTALVICVLLFKGKLNDLLPKLHVRHNDTELSFRMNAANAEAASLGKPEDTLLPSKEEKDKFSQHANISPSGAILETWADVEATIRDNLTPKDESLRYRPATQIMRNLRNEGRIDSTTIALFDDLRAIRNNIAHGANNIPTTTDGAIQYRRLADMLISTLNASRADTGKI